MKKSQANEDQAGVGPSGDKGQKFKQKVVEYFREATIDEAEINGVASSTMFEGMEFYIVNTDEKIASK